MDERIWSHTNRTLVWNCLNAIGWILQSSLNAGGPCVCYSQEVVDVNRHVMSTQVKHFISSPIKLVLLKLEKEGARNKSSHLKEGSVRERKLIFRQLLSCTKWLNLKSPRVQACCRTNILACEETAAALAVIGIQYRLHGLAWSLPSPYHFHSPDLF